MPKVSVIIPAYNSEKTIRCTVESVLAQDYRDYEILVMNDGCTDNTVQILLEFKDKIQVFHQKNSGVSVARNELLKKSQGEVIAFMDSDDVWHQKYLKCQMDALDSNPKAIGSFAMKRSFYGTEDSYNADPVEFNVIEDVSTPTKLEFLKEYTTFTGRYTPSFFVIRAKDLFAIGNEPFPADLSSVEDLYLFYKLLLYGTYLVINKPLGGYRILQGSLSHFRFKQVEKTHLAIERLYVEYQKSSDKKMLGKFRNIRASAKRTYAHYLMGAGNDSMAKKMYTNAMLGSNDLQSLTKSLFWLVRSYLPAVLQPHWPAAEREIPKV